MESVKEKAIALKKRLVEIENEKLSIDMELRRMGREVEPKAVYGNLRVIEVPEYKDYDMEAAVEGIQLVDHLLNEDEKDEHLKIFGGFGGISGDWKTNRVSVTYFRNEYGVLNHGGGGWVLLKDGIPCSDEEWEAIKQGNIPDKFKSGNLK